MPREDVENIRRWAAEVEIDYPAYFIKAWIPFNAWFRMRYDHDKSERAILELIKADGNPVQSSITRLLTDTDAEAEGFKEHLAQLHRRLERHTLNNRQRRVTFTNCYVGINPKDRESGTYNAVSYLVERGTGKSSLPKDNVRCELTKTGAPIFIKQQAKYDLIELQSDANFQSLTTQRRAMLEGYYKSINPRLDVDLTDTSNGSIKIGSYEFCDNTNHIFAGLVENLYALRRLLFHGEAVPTSESKASTNRLTTSSDASFRPSYSSQAPNLAQTTYGEPFDSP